MSMPSFSCLSVTKLGINQVILRKVSQLGECLVTVITLVSLTSCDWLRPTVIVRIMRRTGFLANVSKKLSCFCFCTGIPNLAIKSRKPRQIGLEVNKSSCIS